MYLYVLVSGRLKHHQLIREVVTTLLTSFFFLGIVKWRFSKARIWVAGFDNHRESLTDLHNFSTPAVANFLWQWGKWHCFFYLFVLKRVAGWHYTSGISDMSETLDQVTIQRADLAAVVEVSKMLITSMSGICKAFNNDGGNPEVLKIATIALGASLDALENRSHWQFILARSEYNSSFSILSVSITFIELIMVMMSCTVFRGSVSKKRSLHTRIY